mmetsp:Transcript_4954/g.6161  ORF Transcript_4954/g.6161 Transcript_4954/m.6161 type:complete len:174 (+) Transcript_4954:95-616(+)
MSKPADDAKATESKVDSGSKRKSVFVDTIFGAKDETKDAKEVAIVTIQNKSKSDVCQYAGVNEMYFGKVLKEPKDTLLGPGKSHTVFFTSDTEQISGGIKYDIFKDGDKKANNTLLMVFSSRKGALKCNTAFSKKTIKGVYSAMEDGNMSSDKQCSAWTDAGKIYFRWWGDKK